MISGRKQSLSFVTLQINAGRHDYLHRGGWNQVFDQMLPFVVKRRQQLLSSNEIAAFCKSVCIIELHIQYITYIHMQSLAYIMQLPSWPAVRVVDFGQKFKIWLNVYPWYRKSHYESENIKLFENDPH